MLLAIDVGNTNTVFAVFDGSEVVDTWRLSTESKRTADEYSLSLEHLMGKSGIEFAKIKNVIISSVVPECIFTFKVLAKKYFGCELMVVGESDLFLPINIKLDKPSEIGADRIVNSVAATNKYKEPCIIIDFGTATTFDLVSENSDYLGGVIAPGVELSLDALHAAAAKLPKIAVKKPAKVVGKDTVSAMQSGIYWGYIGMIEGIIKNISEEYGKSAKVIATGGLAPLYSSATEVIDVIEPDLTIDGLKQIFDLNKDNIINIQEAQN